MVWVIVFAGLGPNDILILLSKINYGRSPVAFPLREDRSAARTPTS